jgi:hypothetical protein
MDTESTNEQSNDVPDQDAEPTMTAPGEDRPDGTRDSLQPDPGPTKRHGDPMTDIDDEIRSGGGGND